VLDDVEVIHQECAHLCVLAIGLESNIGGCSTSGLERRVVHVHGEQIVPKRSERHDELGSVPVESAVDGIVVLASF
jgi:hypothetical protein